MSSSENNLLQLYATFKLYYFSNYCFSKSLYRQTSNGALCRNSVHNAYWMCNVSPPPQCKLLSAMPNVVMREGEGGDEAIQDETVRKSTRIICMNTISINV